ncbi:hypothetical protein EPA93_16570 [Ktedonosporobacter rubrisoli]|uniref:FAD-binding domain-containing protein n=1 Tax=Ktedonosporobacter rubrisoli TaxID=2509675 RepID=A0A4P6JRR1_KTERU|nr:FAD-dependent monooxygenase [Ktedonosporobacter rubrisoli]QBD77516.1 hypothetical protein EPA93_16570 [Ktedonosporobacter rubrisoli]
MAQQIGSQSWDTDVLIVGAGPVGLTLACELLRRGVSCRLIEQLETPYTIVRAHALQPRTLELFDRMGLIEPVLRQGGEVPPWYLYDGQKRVGELGFAPLKQEPYPGMWFIQQPTVEHILHERLQELGGNIEYSHNLTQLQNSPNGITATVVAPDKTVELRARYLVGCDGGHSTTRHLLGIPFTGKTLPGLLLIAEVDMDWARSRNRAHIWLHPNGLFSATFIEEVGKWQLVVAAPALSREQVPTASLDLFQQLFQQRTGDMHTRLSNPSWTSVFAINQRLARNYRQEQAFLAGDAAHVHSPAGGLGMNTGIQDAYNLAWKLALVIKDRAYPALLDTYEEERRPVGELLLQATEANTTVALSGNAGMRFMRDHLLLPLTRLPALKRKATQRGAQLDLNYRTSSLARSDELSNVKTAYSAAYLQNKLLQLVTPTLLQAGDRAPDGTCLQALDHNATSLFQEMRGTSWHLLLFAGRPGPRPYIQGLIGLAQQIEARLGAWSSEVLPLLIISSYQQLRAHNWPGKVLLDPEGRLHKRYGAQGQALYLVRPDGYIGFRGFPGRPEALFDYLDTIFLPPQISPTKEEAHV